MKLSSIALALPLFFAPSFADAAEILSVKTSSANFRENPHEAAKIKFSADKFFPVEVVEKKKGWVKVKDFEGDTAWVADKVLGKQATIVISSDKANIRESASTTSDVVFKVERGEVFKIEERKSGWLKVVDARGDGGWIRADMTWGDPDAKEDDKKLDTEKPKTEPSGPAQAKEAEKEKADKPVLETIEVKLMKPEHLQALCHSYVHFVFDSAIAPPSDLEVLCRTLLKDVKEKKAEKADKPVEKKADKKADKPKPEKKADKKADKKPSAKPKK
ncbi:MAG: SH3 domain-containing protein [Polyangiaceae bacterium]|nr:SH3 domain-containing protein [Polyangiaceae bacterium]